MHLCLEFVNTPSVAAPRRPSHGMPNPRPHRDFGALAARAVHLAWWVQRPRGDHDFTYKEKDRKSTRLNSSHLVISYAVFCLKKKKTKAMRCTFRKVGVLQKTCSNG